MPPPLRPAPAPVQVDTRRLVAVGTALFALAALVIAVVPSWRQYADSLPLWTAIAGAGLGAFGQLVMRWQKAP